MNFKKIAITAAAAGVMLSSAIPALANGRYHRSSNDVEIDIENEDTNVRNNVLTVANTGLNEVEGGRGGHHGGPSSLGGGSHGGRGGSISTGNATAVSSVSNDVNYNEVDLCDCLGDRRGDVELDIENEDTDVTNNVLTVANTGLNGVDGSGRIRTGNAGATGVVSNFVNTNIVGGSSN